MAELDTSPARTSTPASPIGSRAGDTLYLVQPPKEPEGLVPKVDWHSEDDLVKWVDCLVAVLRQFHRCELCRGPSFWNLDRAAGIRYYVHKCVLDGKTTKKKVSWREFLDKVAPVIFESPQWKTPDGEDEDPHLQAWARYAFSEACAYKLKTRGEKLADVKRAVIRARAEEAGRSPMTPLQIALGSAPSSALTTPRTSASSAFTYSPTSTVGASPETPSRPEKRKRVLSPELAVVPSSQPDSDRAEEDADEPGSPWQPLTQEGPSFLEREPTPEDNEGDGPIPIDWTRHANAIQSLLRGDQPSAAPKIAEVAWWSGLSRAKPSAICEHLHTLGFDTERILHIHHPEGQDHVATMVLEPATLALFQARIRFLGLHSVPGSPMGLTTEPPYSVLFGHPAEQLAPPPTPTELIQARSVVLDKLRAMRTRASELCKPALAAAYDARVRELGYLWDRA